MFNWLKKLFGTDVPDTPVIAQEVTTETPKSNVGKVKEVVSDIPKAKTSKPKTKKTVKADLTAMSKKDLLALAKAEGVKANASLKKDELIERINAG